jgi:hypothetical protein
LTFACSTDDEGAWFLNDKFLGTNVSCASSDITFNFNAGQNKIEAFYTEGTGGDWWYMTPSLTSRIGAEFLGLSADPLNLFSQTTTPVCLSDNNTINENTIFSLGNIKVTGQAAIDDSKAKIRDIINSGYIKGNNDHSITVYYNYPNLINEDIELYYLGME